jgi:hypothetical protein
VVCSGLVCVTILLLTGRRILEALPLPRYGNLPTRHQSPTLLVTMARDQKKSSTGANVSGVALALAPVSGVI